MSRYTTLLLGCWLAGSAGAAEIGVVVRDVDARSGPGTVPPYYFTDRLRTGDRVEILGERNGFLAIAPPPGSFSLVPKAGVQLARNQGDRIGVIAVQGGADTFVGGPLASQYSVQGVKLNQGAQIRILGEMDVMASQGPTPFYKIEPQEEMRFIPGDAVQGRNNVVQASVRSTTTPGSPDPNYQPPPPMNPGGFAPPPSNFAGNQPAGGGYIPPAQLSVDLSQLRASAEQAYRRGESSNDWHEARRLYEQLAQANHSELRLEALNRLEYIRMRQARAVNNGLNSPYIPPTDVSRIPPTGNRYPNYQPTNAYARNTGYTYEPTRMNTGSGGWAPVRPAPPSNNPPIPSSSSQPISPATYNLPPGQPYRDPNYVPPVGYQPPPLQPLPPSPAVPPLNNPGVGGFQPPPPAPMTQSSGPGRLLRAQPTDQGRPLYYLQDHTGQLRCYVVPTPGLNLEPYVNGSVELLGSAQTYRSDLRGNIMTANQVIPLDR